MKNDWKQRMAGMLTAALLLSALGGCGSATTEESEPADAGTSTDATADSDTDSTSGANEVTDLTLYGVIDPQISTQQVIADKLGYFKEEGLNVTNKLMQSGGDISPLISGGTAEVSFESTYTDIALAANNVGVKVVAAMADIGNTQCVVARKGVTIGSPKDLEGKTIGIASGAGVLIAIRNMCKDTGVDIDKIKFVILSPSEQIASFEKGDIDIMACWEPWVTNAVKLGGTLLFSGRKSYLPGYEGDVDWLSFYTTMQATDSFIEKNPNTIGSLLKALKKATDYIAENPDDAAKVVAEGINQDPADVKEIMAKYTYTMEYSKAFVDASISMADFMKEMGNIPAAPDISQYTSPSLLQSVLPELYTAS
ncbi:MAG: ABC transporter substrate-binding protein [Intestinibacillus sp.]